MIDGKRTGTSNLLKTKIVKNEQLFRKMFKMVKNGQLSRMFKMVKNGQLSRMSKNVQNGQLYSMKHTLS